MTTNLIITPLLPTDPDIARAMLLDFVSEANAFLADTLPEWNSGILVTDNDGYIAAATSLIGFIAYESIQGTDPISIIHGIVFEESLWADLDVIGPEVNANLATLIAPEL